MVLIYYGKRMFSDITTYSIDNDSISDIVVAIIPTLITYSTGSSSIKILLNLFFSIKEEKMSHKSIRVMLISLGNNLLHMYDSFAS